MVSTLLLRTPDPLPSESILGYVLRVSEINGYETPWHVWRHAGYEQGEMLTAGFTVQRVAAAFGKASELLEKHAYRGQDADGETRYQVNGQPIGSGLASAPLRLRRPWPVHLYVARNQLQPSNASRKAQSPGDCEGMWLRTKRLLQFPGDRSANRSDGRGRPTDR